MAFNTGNPIGSTDARDLSDNAENFDEAINDRTNQTWTDRLGVARKTVWGAFSEITYKTPVSYAIGISFLTTDANKTVEEAGVVYAPLNSALPFTTSGTFSGDDDARFYPVQDKNNVIRVTSVAESFAGLAGLDGAQYRAKGWQNNTLYGGALYVYSASTAKSLHDGGKYVSPTVPAVSAQAGVDFQARRDAFLSATGETDGAGNGVFVAIEELNELNYGAVGGGLTDDSAPLSAYFNSTNTIRTAAKAYLVTQAITVLNDEIDCAFGGTKFINGGPTFLITFGSTSDTPIYDGLNISGGNFEQQDAGTTENRNFIRVSGTSDVNINTRCKNVSNGGIYIEAGCERGDVTVKIIGKTGYSTIRGVWLNGGTASDYASQLVDTTSVTRNGTVVPQYAVKDFTIRGKIKLSAYAVYAMNTRDCAVIGMDIDISGAGANRCVAVNNYSPGFRVIGNTLRSDRSSTGVLVTQASDGVIISNNIFKGNFGGNRDIYVQYLAEATITGNEFRTDSVQQIEINMGGQAVVSDNYSDSPGGYSANYRFVTVETLDPNVSSTGTVGNTATILPGSVIRNNVIKQARIGIQASQVVSADGTRYAGISSLVIKGNTLKDWNLSEGGGAEYGATITTTDDTYPINVTYYDNDMLPPENARRNSANLVGDGSIDIRSDVQLAVFRVSIASGSTTTTKIYGANFSCNSGLTANNLFISPRTIGGASGAAVASVMSIVDVDGNVYSYDIVKSGTSYLVTLRNSSGASIALTTTDARVDVVISGEAS